MVVLGIETATSVLSVGLVEDGKIIADYRLDKNLSHAEKLPLFVERILEDTGIAGENISLIAVSNGPGSFTGLRIGLGVAKGLALGWKTELIAVPTPDAIVRQIPVDAPCAGILLNSRRGEVYQSLYMQKEGRWVTEGEIHCVLQDDLGEELKEKDILLAGNGCSTFKELLEEECPKVRILDEELVQPSGASVALAGQALYESGERSNPSQIVPLYFKAFQGVT